MLRKVMKTVLGDPIERALSKYREVVERINALEPEIHNLSDEALRAKTDEFRNRLQNGETLDELLVEAFAVVREAAVRTIGLRHYDVQMIGGIVLHEGRIAEMKTGEGKTLVATLPMYLNALEGKGVHLVTPNDYLSKVGLQTMGPVYHFLGLTAAVIQNTGGRPDTGSFIFDPDFDTDDDRFLHLRPITRRESYAADITYGTNNEFGFDYLRDNMVFEDAQLAQRSLHYAIVDEIDNILIDEARTPLIISGLADQPSDLYKQFAEIVRKLKVSSPDSVEEENPDGDYVVDIKDRITYLTEAGVEKVEQVLGVDQLYSSENSEIIPYLDNCLRARALYHRDKEYIVKDGEIIIVDEFTGRLMHGRRFSEGLHQAIEAKEGVQIRRENVTMATITFQNFFRMYDKLAGMTGTAATEGEEFEKIYNLEVVAIPTNLPVIREDHEDLIFISEKAKFDAVVKEIKYRSQEKLQPVLVGTVAIETSERLSKALKRGGVDHDILNAKQHEREAGIIAQAGRPGAVTIATNMAGRGVDILLGGNPEGLAREKLRKQGIDVTEATPEQWQSAFQEALTECKEDRKKVIEAGGLFVLGTERHDARRIDNQLRGRSGRQGDPGASRFFLSLEDDLMKRFAPDRIKNFMEWANMPPDEPIQHSMISKSIAQAQMRVEGHNFDIRKRVLEYDDVVNKQREIIYEQRHGWLFKDDEQVHEDYFNIIEESIAEVLDEFLGGEVSFDGEAMYRQLFTIFPLPDHLTPDTLEEMDEDALEKALLVAAREAFDRKKEELDGHQPGLMAQIERRMMLRAIDNNWVRHLTDLDVLREGIGLMSIAQRDPLVEYQREGFAMFNGLQSQVRKQASHDIFSVNVQRASQQPIRRRAQVVQSTNGNAKEKPQTVRKVKRPGRNDPCWCGSGKKYKHCHLREDKNAVKTP